MALHHHPAADRDAGRSAIRASCGSNLAYCWRPDRPQLDADLASKDSSGAPLLSQHVLAGRRSGACLSTLQITFPSAVAVIAAPSPRPRRVAQPACCARIWLPGGASARLCLAPAGRRPTTSITTWPSLTSATDQDPAGWWSLRPLQDRYPATSRIDLRPKSLIQSAQQQSETVLGEVLEGEPARHW